MKIDSLVCFQAVTKYKSFSRAADSLFISQSSLSKKIMSLEEELGGELFIRKGNNAVLLSSFGEYVSNYINNITEDYDILLSATDNYRLNHQRKMIIGTFLNIAHSGLLKPITSFEVAEANFYIETLEKDHTNLKSLLQTKQAEICFGYKELLGDVPDYLVTPLYSDPLILITTKEFADMNGWGKSINLAALKNIRFCFPREDMEIFTFLVNSCKANGFIPQLTNSDVRLGTIRHYISLGMRCTLQFESISRSKFYNDRFTFIKLENQPRLTMAMYSDNTRPRRIRDAFVRHIQGYYYDTDR
ncbi:MAG: LysR family transcriptional regulator [Clostridiales bacterium]|nr:LysR family transcriptional regulator [Clostridiales bacterium]